MKVSLVCLPFAGAGPSFFNEWKENDDRFEFVTPLLPGREKRLMDPPFTNVHDAAAAVVEELTSELDKQQPIIVFGHSLGAVMAYEVALGLAKTEKFNVAGLVVSGSPDPWTQRKVRASDIADNDIFIEQVVAFSGSNHEALNNPMMRELLLPALRADVQMHENYVPKSSDTTDVSILTVRGNEDDLVNAAQTQQWDAASSKTVEHKELAGGHMYFVEDGEALLGLIGDFAGRILA